MRSRAVGVAAAVVFNAVALAACSSSPSETSSQKKAVAGILSNSAPKTDAAQTGDTGSTGTTASGPRPTPSGAGVTTTAVTTAPSAAANVSHVTTTTMRAHATTTTRAPSASSPTTTTRPRVAATTTTTRPPATTTTTVAPCFVDQSTHSCVDQNAACPSEAGTRAVWNGISAAPEVLTCRATGNGSQLEWLP